MRNQTLLGLCLLLLTSCLCGAAEFKVGCAAVEITPPVGMPLGSGYVYAPSRGVHDPLWAKALVVESDGSRAAIVACDSMGLPRRIIEPARALIRERAGLPAECVMVVATHTHSGPGTDPVPVSFLKDPEAKIASEYFAALSSKIAESVSQALANMVPARIWAGMARESAVSFNRRYLMKDGSVGWNPGRMNPDIVRPAGPIDPDLPVVYFDTPEGRPLLTFVNFPLQVAVVASSAGYRFSADYPYTIATALANVKGPEMLTMFTGGASANVNHVNVNDPKQLGGLAEAARIGTILAADVLRLYPALKPLPEGAVRARSEILSFPAPELTDEQKRRARERFEQQRALKLPLLEIAGAYRILSLAALEGRPLTAEVQVITVGRELAWVGLPGEVFTELGMAIRNGSPFTHTIVSSLANDYLSYFINRKAYAEGNYEAVVTRFPPGAGEALVDAAVRMLAESWKATGK